MGEKEKKKTGALINLLKRAGFLAGEAYLRGVA